MITSSARYVAVHFVEAEGLCDLMAFVKLE